MATERFVISALEASFMKDHDLLGKQDPYVVFELGSEKITTPAIKSGGTNCSWEESFTLIGRNSASDLQATVYNKNTLRLVDDMLMAFAALRKPGFGFTEHRKDTKCVEMFQSICWPLAIICRADTLLGMATHRILHKVEPGKLKMELTDKKGSNTGEIQFILQASGGRFAQQSGASTGTGSGVGSGAGAGAGAAGAAGLGAGKPAHIHIFYSCTKSAAMWLNSWNLMSIAGSASTGSGRGRGVESDEARNTAYEGSTASGARSGATGATGTQGYSSGTQGYSGTSGSAGVTEGVRGLNITDKSGVSCYYLSATFCG